MLTSCSFVDEVVEKSRLEWLQRRLLIAEEFSLGFAHSPALLRVAVSRSPTGFKSPR